MLSLNEKKGESNVREDAVAIATIIWPGNMSSESRHWHFKVKIPTLTGILCPVWLYAKTRSGRNCEHPSPLPHPAPPKATNLLVLSPKLTSLSPKVMSWGYPGLKGPNPPAPGCSGSPMAVALAVMPTRAGSTPGARITCNER